MMKSVAVLVGILVVTKVALAESLPNISTQQAPVAQTEQKSVDRQVATPFDEKTPTFAMGVCQIVANGSEADKRSASTGYVLSPNEEVKSYINWHEHHAIENTTNTSVLVQPKHGTLRKVTEADKGVLYTDTDSLDPAVSYYTYLPEVGYRGKDSGTVLVNFGTLKAKVVYFFQVTDDNFIGECTEADLCEKHYWKISSTLISNNAFKPVPAPSTRAVIVEKYVAQNEEKKAVTLSPGMFVTFNDANNEEVHIDTGAGESYPGEPVWVPKKILATKDSFVSVNKWNGVKHATFEGIDTGNEYTINSDGSTVSLIGDPCGKSKPIPGHLYRFQNILWMRDSKNDDLWQGNAFMILPSGELRQLE